MKRRLAALVVLSFAAALPVAASTKTWVGTSSDMETGTNWSLPGVPVAGDTALFNGPVPFMPTLSTADLTLTAFNFAGSTPYTVTVDGSTFNSGFEFTGAGGGVSNTSGIDQTLKAIKGGAILFDVGTSADITNSRHVIYDVDSTTGFSSGGMAFFQAVAGSATINLGLSSSIPTILYFAGTGADAQNSTINASNGAEVVFFNNSPSAGNSTINLTGPNTELGFGNSSQLSNATINANSNVIILLDTTNSSSTAKVSLKTSSIIFLSIELDRLTSDSTSNVIFGASGTSLTVNNPNNGDSIDGPITTSLSTFNSFTKGGPNTLSITNPGNNYTGGTIVLDGQLNVTHLSLPVATIQPSATVQNAGILNFTDSGIVSYTGSSSLVNSTSTLAMGGTGTLTLKGLISGAGMVVVNNGTLVLGHADTYTGGTFIQNGILILNSSGSIAPTGDVSMGGIGVSVFDISSAAPSSVTIGNFSGDGQATVKLGANNLITNATTNTTYGGLFSGTGNLIKQGPATLNLTGNNTTYTSAVFVNQGNLALNGTLGGNVIANNGGTFSGNGTVLGNVLINPGATVSPGNSIGSMVAGTYTQMPFGIYALDLDFSGNSDLITVQGDASLDGAIVVSGVINPSLTYLIMTIGGTQTGAFANVVANPLFAPTVVYFGPNVFLQFTSANIYPYANTFNQQQVGRQLQTITMPTPQLQAILNELAVLASDPDTVNEARRALDQMSGQQYTFSLITAELNGSQFLRRLYDPLRSIVTRIPCECCDPCGYGQNYCYNMITCGQIQPWLEVGGGYSTLSGNRNVRGMHYDEFEVTGGLQTTYDQLTVGIAGSYVRDEIHYDVGGSGTNQTGFGAIYGLYRPCGWYVLTDIAYGCSQNKVRRHINIGNLHYRPHGKPNLYQLDGYVEGGIDYCCGGLLMQPFLGIEWDYIHRKGFDEAGGDPLNLSLGKRCRTTAYSRLGVHLTAEQCGCDILSMSLDLAWVCRLNKTHNDICERFQSFGSSSGFLIKGISISDNYFDAALTLSADIYCNLNLYAEASFTGSSNNKSYNGLVGVKYSW